MRQTSLLAAAVGVCALTAGATEDRARTVPLHLAGIREVVLLVHVAPSSGYPDAESAGVTAAVTRNAERTLVDHGCKVARLYADAAENAPVVSIETTVDTVPGTSLRSVHTRLMVQEVVSLMRSGGRTTAPSATTWWSDDVQHVAAADVESVAIPAQWQQWKAS